MTKPKYPDTPEGRAAKHAVARATGRANVRHRWPEGRPTKQVPRVISDPDEEDIWLAEAEAHVAGFHEMSRTEQRRAAKRFLDAYMAQETAAVETNTEPPTGVDAETQKVYWRREGQLQRERVAHDLRMAARHQRLADQADIELGRLLMEAGDAE